MAEAVCDTGPLLHLDEVGNLRTIRTFSRLILPDRVAVELNDYGLPFQLFYGGTDTVSSRS